MILLGKRVGVDGFSPAFDMKAPFSDLGLFIVRTIKKILAYVWGYINFCRLPARLVLFFSHLFPKGGAKGARRHKIFKIFLHSRYFCELTPFRQHKNNHAYAQLNFLRFSEARGLFKILKLPNLYFSLKKY